MLLRKIIVATLFLLGIICLTFSIVRFYSNNLKKYTQSPQKTLKFPENECDSCFAPIMQ